MSKAVPVVIKFYDHYSAAGDDLNHCICEAIGWLTKEDKVCYYLCTWSADSKVFDQNSEYLCILKSTVIKKTVLK